MKTIARFFLHAAAIAAVLPPCAVFGSHAGQPIQASSKPAAANPLTRIVCDPPTFQNCQRMESVTAPRVIHSETPAYPAEAQRLGLVGVSVVSLVIDPEGMPRNLSTVHSIAAGVPAADRNAAMQMDKSALACVRKFRFTPATLDGKPVATRVQVKMHFHRTAEQ
ncbi:MAG TPA: TonB family protein [Acidobacteriaceae bacterium]